MSKDKCQCRFKEKCWVYKEDRCDVKTPRNPNCYEYMGLEMEWEEKLK